MSQVFHYIELEDCWEIVQPFLMKDSIQNQTRFVSCLNGFNPDLLFPAVLVYQACIFIDYIALGSIRPSVCQSICQCSPTWGYIWSRQVCLSVAKGHLRLALCSGQLSSSSAGEHKRTERRRTLPNLLSPCFTRAMWSIKMDKRPTVGAKILTSLSIGRLNR